MNYETLEQLLNRNNVPRKYYSFSGAGGGDVWALELLAGKWTLSYYSQRGDREEKAVFTAEEQGCVALFDKLVQTMLNEEGRTISLDA